jgi:hypothetical protein
VARDGADGVRVRARARADTINTGAINAIRKARLGAAAGILVAVSGIAAVLGVAVSGAVRIVAAVHDGFVFGIARAMLLCAIVSIVGVALAALLMRRWDVAREDEEAVAEGAVAAPML